MTDLGTAAMTRWVKLTNCANGLDAELLAERLRGSGLQAQTRGNDIVGIVGPGFQGTTTRGVDVLVLDVELADARRVLEGGEAESYDEDE
jgi:hypothetical protein